MPVDTMAPEIADSDAESDIVAPDEAVAEELLSPPATRPDGSAANNATQRLSELNSSADNRSGSTDKLMDGLNRSRHDGTRDNESEMTNTGDKRRRAQSEGLATGVAPAEEPKSKRSKTYGSKTRDSDLDLFGAGPLEMERQTTEPEHKAQDLAEEELPSLPSDEWTSPTHVQRERDRPRRVVSLLQQPMAHHNHHVTTATSSMGGYQSINLDFRGGIDMHTNPFGSISQVSVDNAVSTDAVPRSHDDRLNDMIEQFAGPGIQSQMTTSPVREGTPLAPPVEPLSQVEAQDTIPDGTTALEEQDPLDERPSKRQRTDTAASDLTTMAAPTAQATSDSIESKNEVPDAPQAKKRGRPKSKKKTDDVDELAEEEPKHTSMGPPPVEEQQITARSRANTADLSSQASQSSQPASNTKKKRQRNKTGERREEELKKLPSSELNLSDEQLIGLPKEHYKPRPSRSRSKRVDVPAETSTPLKDREDSAVPSQSATPASKPSTGKSKKSKVKRAKTAGGALLKASTPMISDGEDDVVWMESKPAAVKLDLPPSLDVLKQESPEDKQEESEDELQQPGFPGRKAPGPIVSVEIPLIRDEGEAQSDGASDKKTKKKRGRPKKSAPEVQTAPIEERPEAEGTKAESKDASKEGERPALAAKDPNTSTTKPKEKAKSKGNAKSKLTITDSDDEDECDAAQDQENLLSTTSKPSTPADKENPPPAAPADLTPTKPTTPTPDKKPTHSPIKPTPLSAASASSAAAATRHRIGLSKRSKIPSLLRKVDRSKPPPTKTGIKVTELKIKGVNVDDGNGDAEADGENKPWTGVLRDKDGRLVEWDF